MNSSEEKVRTIASSLSAPMRRMLATGMGGEGSDRVYGNSNTGAALVQRGLINLGFKHYWTPLGREVARVLWPDRVRPIEELHAMALSENAERFVTRWSGATDGHRRPPAQIRRGGAVITPAPADKVARFEAEGKTYTWMLRTAMRHRDWLRQWLIRHGIDPSNTDLADVMAAVERDHAEALAENDPVSTAQKAALRRVLIALQDNIEGAREHCTASGHSHAFRDCSEVFAPDDIRQIVSSAARHLGIYDLT